MGKEILTFGDIKIEKKNYCHKRPIYLKDIDIYKVLVSIYGFFNKKI